MRFICPLGSSGSAYAYQCFIFCEECLMSMDALELYGCSRVTEIINCRIPCSFVLIGRSISLIYDLP